MVNVGKYTIHGWYGFNKSLLCIGNYIVNKSTIWLQLAQTLPIFGTVWNYPPLPIHPSPLKPHAKIYPDLPPLKPMEDHDNHLYRHPKAGLRTGRSNAISSLNQINISQTPPIWKVKWDASLCAKGM